jgi:hypothetical protein
LSWGRLDRQNTVRRSGIVGAGRPGHNGCRIPVPLSDALPVPLSDDLPVPLSDELMATIAVDWLVPRLDRRYGGNTALSWTRDRSSSHNPPCPGGAVRSILRRA